MLCIQQETTAGSPSLDIGNSTTCEYKLLNPCLDIIDLTCWSQRVVAIAVAQHCVGRCQMGIAYSPEKYALPRIMIPSYNVVVAYVLIALNEMNLPRSQVTIFLIIH